MTKDTMQEAEVLEALNRALALQWNSIVQQTLAASTVSGLAAGWFHGLFGPSAREDLDDAAAIAAKVAALGGTPATEPAPSKPWSADPIEALEALADTKTRLLEALTAVIPPTGTEPRSEAVEHLVEHVIHRTQTKLDLIRRALRTPPGE